MCQAKNKFLFCTCEEDTNTPKSSEFLQDYSWTLTNFLGLKKTMIRGKIVAPQKDLGNGLSVERILEQLNGQVKTFDFEYQASEKDCLEIRLSNPNGGSKYFKLLFKDGHWMEGSNPAFITLSKTIASGKVRKLNL